MTSVVDIVRTLAPLARAPYLDAFEGGGPLLQEHGVVTPKRLAHFLAQVLHESGALRLERENMNYRAERLLEVFGSNHSAKVTPSEAAALAGRPEAIAERVYGLGNPKKAEELGNVNSGDGYRYRGGGLMQTTGRFNYRETGRQCGVDFEGQPELISSSEHALKPALSEWSASKLNELADADDLVSISRAINFGNTRSTRTPNGIDDRRRWLVKAKSVIGDDDAHFSPALAVTSIQADTQGRPSLYSLSEIKKRLIGLDIFTGTVDEVFDARTKDAVHAWLLNQGVRLFEAWPDLRLIIAAAQALCRHDGIEAGPIDGLMGPQTREAFDVYSRSGGSTAGNAVRKAWRDELDGIDSAPVLSGVATKWPREKDVATFFGAVGSHQVMLSLPFPMRLAWDLDTVVSKVSCHEKVKDSLARIWSRTYEHYGISEIRRLRLDLFGGCLNVRRKRGGTAWSMHAWGIAWDVDPSNNSLRMGRDEASLDEQVYEAFWGFVYDEGAIGLGRECDFDWMHFQFARL